MNVISPVLHIFVSRLHSKHRASLTQRALDSPGLVDYFSYPHHGQKMHKNFSSQTCLKDEESQKFRDGQISLIIQFFLCSSRLRHYLALQASYELD